MTTYRVIASATLPDGQCWRYASSRHRTLPEALTAFRARQQEGYDTGTLTPVGTRESPV